MMSTVSIPATQGPSADHVPELRAGDRLTRAEFERRYAAMPHVKKAELIEGVVYLPSPVTQEDHGAPHFDVITWLGVYRAGTPGVEGGDNATLRLDLDSYDLHDKLHAYRRNEVREYVVWRVWDRAIDWFVLRDDRYQRLPLDAEGQYQSEIFPGLWLAPAALLRSDLAQVLAVLQQGLASPEHATFVNRLQRQRSAAT